LVISTIMNREYESVIACWVSVQHWAGFRHTSHRIPRISAGFT
jgi:hypothetical protein